MKPTDSLKRKMGFSTCMQKDTWIFELCVCVCSCVEFDGTCWDHLGWRGCGGVHNDEHALTRILIRKHGVGVAHLAHGDGLIASHCCKVKVKQR